MLERPLLVPGHLLVQAHKHCLFAHLETLFADTSERMAYTKTLKKHWSGQCHIGDQMVAMNAHPIEGRLQRNAAGRFGPAGRLIGRLTAGEGADSDRWHHHWK